MTTGGSRGSASRMRISYLSLTQTQETVLNIGNFSICAGTTKRGEERYLVSALEGGELVDGQIKRVQRFTAACRSKG